MIVNKTNYSIHKWKCKNHRFIYPIDLKPLDIEYKMWETEEEVIYWSRDRIKYTVPKGFKTDGASIPKLFWSLIGSPVRGKYVNAALIHDWFYYTGEVTRKRADALFHEAMTLLEVSFWRRKLMWLAVRGFSGIIWNRRYKK